MLRVCNLVVLVCLNERTSGGAKNPKLQAELYWVGVDQLFDVVVVFVHGAHRSIIPAHAQIPANTTTAAIATAKIVQFIFDPLVYFP